MSAGRLRDLIAVQRLVEGDDGHGNVETGWAELMVIWADVRETPGKERVEAGRLQSGATATIRVRLDPDTAAITAKDRIVARGKTWNIRGLAQVDRHGAVLDILCESGVAA